MKRLFFLSFFLLFLIPARPAQAQCAGACVQATSSRNFSTATCPETFSGNITAGNAVIGYVWWDDNTTVLNSVTGSDTFTLLNNPTTNTGFANSSAASFVTASSVGGYTTVTANFGSAVNECRVYVMEVHPTTTATLDQHNINPQNPSAGTDTATSGTVTTIHSGEFIFGAGTSSSSTSIAAGTGFTGVGASAGQMEYAIQSSAGSIATTFSPSGSGDLYLISIVTLDMGSSPAPKNLVTMMGGGIGKLQ